MNRELKRTVANLTVEQREKALSKFRLIEPILNGSIKLQEASEQQSIPVSTLKRWVTRYKKNGLCDLVRKARADKGKLRGSPLELQMLIEGMALKQPNFSTAMVYREVLEICKEKDWNPPCQRKVYNIINRISPALSTLGKQGDKAYEDKYEIIIRREANRPNEIWQADHTLLDIWVFNGDGLPQRPWLTIVMDDYSRAVAGYYIFFDSPSALQTSLALHQAIWRKMHPNWAVCGIPDVFYSDHGSDFISKHMEQVSADIKMRLIFSTAGKPRGRGKIERFFETVNQLFLRQLPGYAADGKLKSAEPAISVKELEERFLDFLLNSYHLREHSTTKMSPKAKWSESCFLPRMPETLEQLDLLLLTVVKTRIVQQDGIRFQGFQYFSLILAPYVREEVVIRYDPRDLAQIRVYYKNKFLCTATCEEIEGKVLIVDEAERLTSQGLDQIRDFYDRSQKGLILIGMPGIEKRLSRYPQLYSRIGFLHQYHSLSHEEIHSILIEKWRYLGLSTKHLNFSPESLSVIMRITRGNFRLLSRLMMQTERIMRINSLSVITQQVLELARECLIIGA